MFGSYQVVVDPDLSALVTLQVVDAAQHGALAGAGRTDDERGFAGMDVEVDAGQHLQITEVLADTAHAHDWQRSDGKCGHQITCSPAGTIDLRCARSARTGRVLRPKCRSSRACRNEAMLTSTRYQSEATISSSMT